MTHFTDTKMKKNAVTANSIQMQLSDCTLLFKQLGERPIQGTKNEFI